MIHLHIPYYGLCARIILALLAIAMSSSAQAACDFPSNPPAGSIVTCSGVTNTPFQVNNIPDVQVTNTGTWVGTGSSSLINFTNGNLTGSRLTNEGVMNWTDVFNPAIGARGAMSMFFTANQATFAEAFNRPGGILNVTLDPAQASSNTSALGGMVVQARGPNGEMLASNEGEINIASSAADDTGIYGMIVRADSTVVVENASSGSINVERSVPNSNSSTGILTEIMDDSTIPVSAVIENAGQINAASSNSNSNLTFGVRMRQRFPTSGNQPGVHTLNNTGTIEASGVTVASVFFDDGGNAFPDITVNIDNSGSIIGNGTDFSSSIFIDGAAIADTSIVNTGQMDGGVFTSRGNDNFEMLSGQITGEFFFFDDGSDTFDLVDGLVDGLLDGGDDVDSADGMIDALNFDTFTGNAPEFVNWELVNVINSAAVLFATDFITETFSTDATGTAIFADTLAVTGDVLNDGTIDMVSPDATGTATITGDVTGTGTLELGVNVSSDMADVLTIDGNTTGSTMAISPNLVDFNPATGNDVLVVEVTGSTAVGDFTLPNGATMQNINGVTYSLSLLGSDWFLTAQGTPDSILDLSKTGTLNDDDGIPGVSAGDTISYVFTVENTGNITLNNITLTDPDATISGGPIPSLAPGASDSGTFTASYDITQADIDAGTFTNTATANSNEGASDDDSDTQALAQTPAIGLIKTSVFNDENDDTFAQAGETISYTFTVTNIGNVTINNLMIDDTTVGVTGLAVTPASLAPGDVGTATFTYTITQPDVDAGNVTNQALATGQAPAGNDVTDLSDDDSLFEDDDTVTPLDQNPAIAIIKSGTFNDENGDTFAQVGETISYTFVVTNTGDVTLNNVTVIDQLVTVSGGPITLAPGDVDSTTFTATYVITLDDLFAGEVVNQATATGEFTDINGDAQSVSDLSDNESNFDDVPTETSLQMQPIEVPTLSAFSMLFLMLLLLTMGMYSARRFNRS